MSSRSFEWGSDLADYAFDHLNLRSFLSKVAVLRNPPTIQITPPVPATVGVQVSRIEVEERIQRWHAANLFGSWDVWLCRRIDDDHLVVFCPIVVPGLGGEILGVLFAAMRGYMYSASVLRSVRDMTVGRVSDCSHVIVRAPRSGKEPPTALWRNRVADCLHLVNQLLLIKLPHLAFRNTAYTLGGIEWRAIPVEGMEQFSRIVLCAAPTDIGSLFSVEAA